MTTRYIFATIVGGKGGASFNYYLDGSGFVPITPSQASLFSPDQINSLKENVANQNGGSVAILPVVIES